MINRRPFLDLLLAAGFGAACALTAEFALAGDQSLWRRAIFAATSAAIDLAPLWAAPAASALLITTGALSILYFRPLSRKGSFACGFATIAVIAMFSPVIA